MDIIQAQHVSSLLRRGSFLSTALLYFVLQLLSLVGSLHFFSQEASAASDVFRVTTYELQPGNYTGTVYTLTLNNELAGDYYAMISGPSNNTATRSPAQDQVRVSGDPHGNFAAGTATNQLQLTRGNASNDWIGAVTVIECLIDCGVSGFVLSEVLVTTLAGSVSGVQQTTTATLATNYSANTVPFGGRFGGGVNTTTLDANVYSTTVAARVTKQNGNQIHIDRFGGEGRILAQATFVTYVVEFGSAWSVQDVNVTGTASGNGLDATSEYSSAAITSVNRDQTFIWGSGFTRDDGLGDGALGQAITLGDGVVQNPTESVVSVGGEGSLVAPGRNFQIFVISHPNLGVDHVFRPRGDPGPSTGFQELNITVDAPRNSESYNNASSTVQSTEGYRVPLFYNTSSGTGQAYSRTGAWGLRLTSGNNLAYWRAYAGQNVTGWIQVMDFGDLQFSNVDTRQQLFRWRDDSVDLNSDGGWLAAENTNLGLQAKNTSLRLRFRVANNGTTPEIAARQYELQFARKGLLDTCSTLSTWTGVSDSTTDALELYDSAFITPDGQAATSSLLSNSNGFSFVSGEGREQADTTAAIGPLGTGSYTELEYALRPTDNAVTGYSYCLRLFDQATLTVLDEYTSYPELYIESTQVAASTLGETGTFTSQPNGGWSTVNFATSYTTPVVVGTTNSHTGQNALVFEARNVTSTSAQMRVCESEGATSNGCDSHTPETVGYMVIDAAVAAVTDGIEAGTFNANGRVDTNPVTTNYAGPFTTTPYVYTNVNTVNSTQFPIEVVVTSTSTLGFTAGICDHLQGSSDDCDPAHGNETVGWIAIEPGNEPFTQQFNMGQVAVANSVWQSVTFTPAFSANPVVIASSQTDTGGQDVEIDEARLVTTTGAQVRYCEIDTFDTCDAHNPDIVAWLAIEPGVILNNVGLDQDGFGFYDNTNAATPTTALAAENTSLTTIDDGNVTQLRIAVQAGAPGVSALSATMKLQYTQATSCQAAAVWTDVGGLGSTEIWRGYANATPSDGATLPSSLLDGGINTPQTYEEVNASAPNPNTIAEGSRGEWGWVVENNGAADFTEYCFRMVLSDGTAFNYTRYPQLTTAAADPNLSPLIPSALDQQRLSTASIPTGDTINDTTIVVVATIGDQNDEDVLELCVEIDELGVAFSDVEDVCARADPYSGSLITASIAVSGLQNNRSYHWQLRVRDAGGLYSPWVSFGGNAEIDTDVAVDTTAPYLAVYDGLTIGADREFNSGELNQLSAIWQTTNGIAPNDVSGITVWLDGSDVENDGTDPVNGASVSTWFDRSGNGNHIAGSGAATFDSTRQAIAFNSTPRPFDDTYDRSGGNNNAMTAFAVVTGNASIGNHVWYETTTPRVSPAENGILGGGTSLSLVSPWSSHIIDSQLLTIDFQSSGTSTAWLGTRQEHQFSETHTFADSQRLTIGDDTTGGNELESGEYVHEIIIYNQDITAADREELWEHLQCKWSLKDCSVTYEYAIGTNPGGTDIVDWSANGAADQVTATGLSLETSKIYYFSIRATDAAGNQTVVSSDGQQVAPTLTFSTSTSTGGVLFDNLNVGNSYTNTKSTTLVTSTNARNGCAVRAYTTGSLENALLDTIGDFTGGTYAAPATWQAGDTGFGYTSSDTVVEGINKFSPATCAGGGSGGPCYAPFSQSEPGDIVADNPGVISGTPITAEQFTITYRVTAPAVQEFGLYATTVIFQATAVY